MTWICFYEIKMKKKVIYRYQMIKLKLHQHANQVDYPSSWIHAMHELFF